MRRKFVGAFWVALLCVVLGEEQPEAEEDRITLGLYVLYDDAFNNRAAFKQSDEELASYFTVLVNTAQAYFRGLSDPSLTLTLVGSERLWDEDIISYVAEDRKKFVDAAATLPILEDAVRWNKSVPVGVDVVFLITGIETKTREDSFTKDWKGLSVPKTICFSAGTEMAKAAGIAHDDGETFNGATVLALQVALLLGASKDSRLTRRCPSTGGFLTSSMKGGIHPYLSECSKNALQGFYYRHFERPNICWKDSPMPADKDNENLPTDFYEEKGHDYCYRHSTRFTSLYTCDRLPVELSLRACEVACCEYLRGSEFR
uniref:Putative secreted metalloprotease n=1 Tax=Amblyomma americanum TaxID=6943 RepID=A0A0C9SEH5_AMBAM